jgi:DNA-binding LacI/PurR family transcriptional regulator
MKSPNSRDVALAAGVSQTTVSLVLNGRTDIAISDETRQRVREASQRLGYRANQLARSLLRGKSHTVGLLVPSLSSSFVAQIAEGVQSAAWDQNHRVLLAHTRYQAAVESRQLDLLLGQQIDGLIVVTGESTLPDLGSRLETAERANVPCVVVDEASMAARVDSVISDDRAGAEQAVRHLISLGHRQIGHLSAGGLTSSSRARYEGYREALQEAGLPYGPSLVVGDAYLRENGAELLQKLLATRKPPTAVFAANDRRLAEALPLLRQRGIRVPEDLALLGYANYDFSNYLDLSSVDQQPMELGQRAMLRLIERIAKPTLKPRLFELPTALVVRGSCGGRRVPESPLTTPGRSPKSHLR